MNLNSFFLVLAALLPALVLSIYIFRKDRVEKEPVSLLLRLLFMGALCCYPAAEAERLIIGVIDGIFAYIPFSEAVYHIYTACYYFVGVALVEEGLKWIVLYFVTKNSREFNCLFDGLIYAIFVSLGFAAFENIFYVLRYGWLNAFMRAVLSVPGHMFFAVMMGWYYSLWHITELASVKERELKATGLIRDGIAPFSYSGYVKLSLIMPVIFHGTYNYCCSVNRIWATVALYIFVVFMYVYCFGKIRKMSDGDGYNSRYVDAMILRKYPHLKEEISETEETFV